MEALKPMNVSRMVAWGAFWTSKSSQSTSKEPLGSLLRTPRELLGGFLGASWGSPGRLLVLQMLPEPQNLLSTAILMQIWAPAPSRKRLGARLGAREGRARARKRARVITRTLVW